MHDCCEQAEDTAGLARAWGALEEGDLTAAAQGVGVDEAGGGDCLGEEGREGGREGGLRGVCLHTLIAEEIENHDVITGKTKCIY